MVASLYLFLGGVAIGAVTGRAVGALVGGMVGLLVGLCVRAVVWLRAHVHDVAPVSERHRVICFPYGQAADCELVGDLNRRRWYDVARCSLVHVQSQVACDKGCVRMMNVARVRPGDGSGEPVPAPAPDASPTVAAHA